jgi:hypothetical protein
MTFRQPSAGRARRWEIKQSSAAMAPTYASLRHIGSSGKRRANVLPLFPWPSFTDSEKAPADHGGG